MCRSTLCGSFNPQILSKSELASSICHFSLFSPFFQTVAILALLIMAACNILYIYDLIHHHDILQLKPNGLDVHPLHKTRSKDSTRKTIKIKVFSGKEKAEIYVNDKEVCFAVLE